ncbi:TraU family protein [Escherichia coli]|uniref:TraU family protein n=1 Tax=Escherichia coli TaxID=562 RepID=UPI003989B865
MCWSCIFPLSLAVSKSVRVRSPTRRTRRCPFRFVRHTAAAVQAYRAGHWLLGADGVDGRHPVTGCMVNLGFSLPAFGKTAQGNGEKDEKQVNGAFYHVHWYKYPLTYWLTSITSLGCLEGGDLEYRLSF